VTHRLADERVSLPSQRRTVFSEHHEGEVQIDPWFAPDGTLRGGVLILPDGSEQVADAATIAGLLGEEELTEARRHLGLVASSNAVLQASEDTGAEADEELIPPLYAIQDSAGVPVMPDSFAMHAGALGERMGAPSSGGWGYDPEHDDDAFGDINPHAALARNLRKLGWRALFGAGWLWDRANSRALPRLRQAVAQLPWPQDGLHRGVTTRRTQKRRRSLAVGAAAALTLLLVTSCMLASLLSRAGRDGVTGLPVNPFDANATLTSAEATHSTMASATATASAIIASGGIPPTPVPTATGAEPTPTSSSGLPCIVFCSNPTATPTPSGPAPTPDPHAPNASVSFTRMSTTAHSPDTVSTYDGAPDDAPGGSTRGQKVSAGPTTRSGGSWGNIWTQIAGPTNTVINVIYFCHNAFPPKIMCQTPAGTRVVDQTANQYDCQTQVQALVDIGVGVYVPCQLYATGPITPSNSSYISAAPCIDCSAEWNDASFPQDPVTLGSNAQFAYFTPNPCNGDGGAAARGNVTSVLAGGLGAGLGADAIGPQVSYSNNGYCGNPSNCGSWSSGQNVGGASTYSICASGSAWKLTYSLSGAQNVQKNRITALPGYALDASTIQVCSSVSVQSINTSNGSAVLSCPAHAAARYVWTASMLTALKSQIAGKTVSEANSILAATTGIAAGSISISMPSGYSNLPGDSNVITIAVN